MGKEHCADPDSCPPNKALSQRIALMDRRYYEVKENYERVSGAIEENTRQMEEAVVNLALASAAVKTLNKSIGEMARINENQHGKLEAEDRSLHKRITDSRTETTKLIGDVKTSMAEKIGDLKVADTKNEGKLGSKLDMGEILKLVLLLSATLGIFKYLLPAAGG